MINGRQPAFWIGLIVSLVAAILGVLTGNSVISDVVAGRITDTTAALAQLATIAAPLIAGLLIRPVVTPTAAPSLNKGTKVTVITPEGQPNTTTTL